VKYWAERTAKAQSALTAKNIKQIEKQMGKYYNRAMETVIADFISVYDKIMHAHTTGKEITTADLYRLDRYWELQGQLQKQLELLGNKELELMAKNFRKEFFDIYAVISIPSGESYSTISKEMVEQMINQIWCADGKSWSNRVWTNTARLKEKLNEQLINCVLTGKRTTELKKILQHEFEVGYYRADAIVRTEMAHIQTEAAKKRYEDYGIEQVEILADEDERRCPECGKLHGKRYYLHEAIPVPAHTNCRCCIVPVIS
jgi:SPP1 gp7 family putative phage head morphogenesis protein